MLYNADLFVFEDQQEVFLQHSMCLSGDSLYVLFLGHQSGRLYPGEDRTFNLINFKSNHSEFIIQTQREVLIEVNARQQLSQLRLRLVHLLTRQHLKCHSTYIVVVSLHSVELVQNARLPFYFLRTHSSCSSPSLHSFLEIHLSLVRCFFHKHAHMFSDHEERVQ